VRANVGIDARLIGTPRWMSDEMKARKLKKEAFLIK